MEHALPDLWLQVPLQAHDALAGLPRLVGRHKDKVGRPPSSHHMVGEYASEGLLQGHMPYLAELPCDLLARRRMHGLHFFMRPLVF